MKTKSFNLSKRIKGSQEEVFNVISNFNEYEHWNTLIPKAKGSLEIGNELQLKMKINGKLKPFNPKVISFKKNVVMHLSKTIGNPVIGEINHFFELQAINDKETIISHTWQGKGILVQIFWKKMTQGFSVFEIYNRDLANQLSKTNG